MLAVMNNNCKVTSYISIHHSFIYMFIHLPPDNNYCGDEEK